MKVNLRIYPGYANEQEIIVFGHVFKRDYLGDKLFDSGRFKNARAVIKLFMMKTLGNINVQFTFRNTTVSTTSLKDGYFRFSIPYSEDLECGWHKFEVTASIEGKSTSAEGEFVKPYPGEFGMISDIDDTFLVSHSNNIFKKLYVMLSRNVEKRKVFDGVVEHYRQLNKAGRNDKSESNAFFYVSSSEWNLFSLIDQFTRLNNFPKAVFKLQKIKLGWFDLLFSGGGNHEHKFHKIKHIMEFYPDLKFVLMGDDSQQDPYIFEQVAKIFPQNIFAVYVRQTKSKKKEKVEKVMNNISSLAETCYFNQSAEAMEHSKEIGLV